MTERPGWIEHGPDMIDGGNIWHFNTPNGTACVDFTPGIGYRGDACWGESIDDGWQGEARETLEGAQVDAEHGLAARKGNRKMTIEERRANWTKVERGYLVLDAEAAQAALDSDGDFDALESLKRALYDLEMHGHEMPKDAA